MYAASKQITYVECVLTWSLAHAYRESMQVMIASRELAAKGRGSLNFCCQSAAASISLGMSAIFAGRDLRHQS